MTCSATSSKIYQVFIPLTGAPGIQSALTGEPLTSAEIYQTLQARGILGQRSITPADLAIHCIDPGPGYPLRIGFRLAEDTVNPYSQQGSFEIQREIGGFSLSAGYNYNRGLKIMRPLDLNIYQAGTREDGRPIVGFHDPLILQDNVYGSWGRSYYHAMIVQLKKPVLGGIHGFRAPHLEQAHRREHRLQFVLRTSLAVGRPQRAGAVPFPPQTPVRRARRDTISPESGQGPRVRAQSAGRLHVFRDHHCAFGRRHST